MLKLFLLAVVSLHLAFSESDSEFWRSTRALAFTYNSGSVAAYPVGTTIIYRPGTTVDYIAGATVIYLYTTTVTFTEETEVYQQNGPVTYEAGRDVTYLGGSQVAYGPGTTVTYKTAGETRYGEFNGNSHAIVGYPSQTSVQYYYGPRGSNLILFQPGTNPLIFYNPGGSTQFGPSAPEVEKDPETSAETTTIGAKTYRMRRNGYSYCSGYSNNGWPRTTYYNRRNGYRSSCNQNGNNNYSYSNNGGSSGYGNSGGGTPSGNGTNTGYNGGYGK